MTITEESEFWPRLSRCINGALRASRDNNIRFVFVDCFVPGTISAQLEQRGLFAEAYVSEDNGRSFFHYQVKMHLSSDALEAYCKGEWAKLLPAPASTHWLRVNRAKQEIEIRISPQVPTEP